MRRISLIITVFLIFLSCKKIERINPIDGIVGIEVLTPRKIDLGTIEVTANLDHVDEVPNVTQRGICWSSENLVPTTKDAFISQGSGSGTFTSTISGLKGNALYYFRAFASNEKTTVYSSVKEFTIKAPYLNTLAATNIKVDGATLSGVIVSNSFDILDYGVLWGSFPDLTYSNNKIEATSKTFSLDLKGLQSGKKYYFRTYANTNEGVAYGDELSFTTSGTSTPSLITTGVTNIGSTVANTGGEITSDGNLQIIDKGVCWSFYNNPTIEDNYKSLGSGSESFSTKLTNLSPNTTYYVRAYATNSKGTSYGNEVSFTTSINSSVTITDGDGNTYNTVTIGTQTWMAENLKTSKYNDGTNIPNITDNTQWQNNTTGAWCYYDNNSANNSKYGKLYNWYAVSPTTNGNKNICPTGWHVPTDVEWTVLTDYLGGESIAGGKMKEVGTTNWNSPNTDATNTSLFTGLPGGLRFSDGDYYRIGNSGYWWSSSENATHDAWDRDLDGGGGAYRGYFNKTYGFSVRCLRD